MPTLSLTPLAGQKLQEIELPGGLEEVEWAEELHRALGQFLCNGDYRGKGAETV